MARLRLKLVMSAGAKISLDKADFSKKLGHPDRPRLVLQAGASENLAGLVGHLFSKPTRVGCES